GRNGRSASRLTLRNVIRTVGGVVATESFELPDDVEQLKALVVAQQHRIRQLEKIAFGRSSEKRAPAPERGVHPNQGHLFLAALVADAEEVAERTGGEGSIESKPAKPRKKGGRRKKLPEHLPRFRTTYELAEADRACRACSHALHEIGEDVREELERIETVVVHEIACKKYGCRHCETGVVTAPGPDRPIEKGILGRGFLATVLVERFAHHMPYHRLEKKYGAEGIDLSRSVLQRSASRTAELLQPIAEQIRREVLESGVIFTDDTPVTIAQAASGGSKKGRVWVYSTRDGRHFYDFTDSRKRDGPLAVLRDFEGYIHADAYPGYDQLYLPDTVTEVACWAHARRKFVESEATDGELAGEAVALIQKLYAIEKTVRELDDDARRAQRQERSRPVLDQIRAWLDLNEACVLPKSPIGKAILYALRQWDALCRYVEDGRLAIDNNAAERALRPFAVGRKNWLFFQQDTGGKTAAILATLIQSARAIGLDAHAYLRDVLVRIAHESDVAKLTPSGWRAHFEAEVRARRESVLQRILAQG
ncbi:MAG: IS66 family transposase, partial [Planctomycetota bacterium]